MLCTGKFSIGKKICKCEKFDNEWILGYNTIENFFYSFEREDSEIPRWKHPDIKLKKIDENLTLKNLSKTFRNYAAEWNRFNFFYSDEWNIRFYRKQAKLGFIAITHFEDNKLHLTPQLQREYAVLDWKNLVIDKKVKKILLSDRIRNEKIELKISPDPAETLENLTTAWPETWIAEIFS